MEREIYRTGIADEVSGRQAVNQRAMETSLDEQPLLCRVCDRTGEINDANTFCVECNDHMCGNCARAHRGSQMTSQHQLLDKFQMPRKSFKARYMCDNHSNTLIEYYCKKQDLLLCRHCITLNHQGCHDDDLIANVCDNVEDSQEFRKVYKCLKDIQNNITQQESKTQANLADIDTNRQNIRLDIDRIKKELHRFVDCLVDDMYREVEALVDTDKNAMTAVTEECDNVATKVKDLVTEMDVKKQSKEKMHLFIVLKTAKKATETLGYKMDSIDLQNRTEKYNFAPDKLLRDIMGSVQKLGQLSVEDEVRVQLATVDRAVNMSEQKLGQLSIADEVLVQSATVDHTVNMSDQQLGQQPVEEVSVQSTEANRAVKQPPTDEPETTVDGNTVELTTNGKSDTSDCFRTSIALLDDDRLVIADSYYVCIQLISLSKKKVLQKLQMVHRPTDITKITKDTLAVTCPRGEYIQIASVSRWFGILSLGRQIPVQGACRGIYYSDARGGDGIMVVSFDSGKVQVIDMSGTILKDLSSDSAGTPLFSWPRCLALSTDGQCVYVSDWDDHSVTGMTLDGQVVFTYRNDKLKHPGGLTVGDDGTIYVCGVWSHNIHLVPSGGGQIKIILGAGTNRMRCPHSIIYNTAEYTLRVAMLGNNNSDVFKRYAVH